MPGIGTISGISPNVRLLLNQFYATNFPNNNTALLFQNYIKNDETALHIINNFPNGYKYLVQTKEPLGIGFKYVYRNLFNGSLEDYTLSEAARASTIYLNPNSHSIIAIKPLQTITNGGSGDDGSGSGGSGDGGSGSGGNGDGGSGSGGKDKYTGNTPLNFKTKFYTNNIAGSDTKTILIIAGVGLVIYFLTK